MAARMLHKLNAKQVAALHEPGRYGDGGGLWLRVDDRGSKRWVFSWERDKRRREMGLGAFVDVSLLQAREKAAAARDLLKQGIDPIEHRRAEEKEKEESKPLQVPLFGDFAREFIDNLEDGWKNAKHRQQWRNSLTMHASRLNKMRVDEIDTDDLIVVLRSIWQKIPETAGRVRGRIERILDAARARKLIVGPWENPARWKGNLTFFLPKRPRLKRGHHAAMPFKQLPTFMVELRKREARAARALELTILCATRTSETLNMQWREVDFEDAIWTIPADRMKMGIAHRIPLSEAAIAILKNQAKEAGSKPGDYVFPGHRHRRPLSSMAMTMVLKRMKLDHFTVHGMRSAFRDYMGEMSDHPEAVIEQALAHQVGDATVRAYRRGDALLKRRIVMQDWAEYLASSLRHPGPNQEGPPEAKSLDVDKIMA